MAITWKSRGNEMMDIKWQGNLSTFPGDAGNRISEPLPSVGHAVAPFQTACYDAWRRYAGGLPGSYPALHDDLVGIAMRFGSHHKPQIFIDPEGMPILFMLDGIHAPSFQVGS